MTSYFVNDHSSVDNLTEQCLNIETHSIQTNSNTSSLGAVFEPPTNMAFNVNTCSAAPDIYLSNSVRVYDVSAENLVPVRGFICGKVNTAGTATMLEGLEHLALLQNDHTSPGFYHTLDTVEGFLLEGLSPVNGCFQSGVQYINNQPALGAGAYGRVYASKLLTNPTQKFVSKIMPLRRFRAAEIRLPRLYPHRNLYKPLGLTWDHDTVHYHCELIQGGTLERLVTSTGPLMVDEIVYVLKTVLEWLQYWHSQGLVHRDLKPQNIMVTNDGDELKVIDCGAACQLDYNEERWSLHGTEMYMSPEMCSNEGHNALTDIWSMGCVGLFLYLGQPPFYKEIQSRQFGTLLYYVATQPEAIQTYVDEVKSPDLKELLKKMLWKKHERFSAERLLEERIMEQASPRQLTEAVKRAGRDIVEYYEEGAGYFPLRSQSSEISSSSEDELDSLNLTAMTPLFSIIQPSNSDDQPPNSGNLPNLQQILPPIRNTEIDIMDTEMGGATESAVSGTIEGAVGGATESLEDFGAAAGMQRTETKKYFKSSTVDSGMDESFHMDRSFQENIEKNEDPIPTVLMEGNSEAAPDDLDTVLYSYTLDNYIHT